MKRPLAFLTLCYLTGICVYIVSFNLYVVLTAIFIISLYSFFYRPQFLKYILTGILIGILGFGRIYVSDFNLRSLQEKNDQKNVKTHLTVADFSQGDSFVAKMKIDNKNVNIRVTNSKTVNLYPGEIIKAKIKLRKPTVNRNSLFNYDTYLKSKNIALCAYTKSVEKTNTYQKGVQGLVYAVRRYLDNVAKTYFKGETRAMYSAMVLGNKSLISDGLYKKLQSGGINHIAVVSGMHLSIIIAAIMILLNHTIGRKKISYIVAIVACIVFAFATGMGASVMRAMFMCIIYQLAKLFYRDADSLTSLSAAVLIMTVISPYTLTNVGFILSALSTLGIILFTVTNEGGITKYIPSFVVDSVLVSLSAQMFTVPCVMYYFNILSPYAVLTNLLVGYVAAFAVILGMGLAVLGFIKPLAFVFALAEKGLIYIILAVCKWISKLPGALLRVNPPDAIFLAIWAGVIIAILINRRNKKLSYIILAVTATIYIATDLFAPHSDIKVSFMSYPNGDCSAIFFDGTSVLIDCENSYDAIARCEKYGKGYYDWGIVSRENINDISELVNKGKVKKVVISSECSLKNKIRTILKDADIKELSFGEQFPLNNEIYMEYLPLKESDEEKCAVKLSWQGKSFISLQSFTADDINKMIESSETINADYIKLPILYKEELIRSDIALNGKIIDDNYEFFKKGE